MERTKRAIQAHNMRQRRGKGKGRKMTGMTTTRRTQGTTGPAIYVNRNLPPEQEENGPRNPRNRFKGALIVLAVALVAMFGASLVGGFWGHFVALSIAYLIVAFALIVPAVAFFRRKTIWEYVKDENTWAYIGMVATCVTLVIALFNPGPALLLPEPTPEQRSVVNDVFNHLVYGAKNAPPKTIPSEPLSWTTGTRFWLKAAGLYGLLTILFSLFAFADEVSAGWKAVVELFKRRREEHNTPHPPAAAPEAEHGRQGRGGRGRGNEPPPPAAGPAHPPGHGGRSVWSLISIEFVAELFAEFVTHFVMNRGRRNNP